MVKGAEPVFWTEALAWECWFAGRDAARQVPIAMRLPCPDCGTLHVDEGEFATKPHHTHACQECGLVWRPAVETTVGVRFLPGFRDEQYTGYTGREEA